MSLDDITVAKWKDKRDVHVISNAHKPEMVPVANRRGVERQKPNIIQDYNNGMSGIDRSDQMLSYHSGLRKTVRWYKKVGVHMVEMMLTNAFYLFVCKIWSKSPLEYSENISRTYCGELGRSIKEREGTESPGQVSLSVDDSFK